MLSDIVEWMVREGCERTHEGNWQFYGEEIMKEFLISIDELVSMERDICRTLYRCKEVLSVDVYCSPTSIAVFDIIFAIDYCPNVEEITDEADF